MEGRTMNDEKKCLRCGSPNLSPSDVQSTGKIYSRPKDAKLVTVLTTGVPVSANICLDCGHVELVVNADKARKIAKAS
jgi:predicted nucleic-acid-binding Zn-ribbon protein